MSPLNRAVLWQAGKIILALLPLIVLTARAIRLGLSPDYPKASSIILIPELSLQGSHLYGYPISYSGFGSFPSNPHVDREYMVAVVVNQPARYVKALLTDRPRPSYIVDPSITLQSQDVDKPTSLYALDRSFGGLPLAGFNKVAQHPKVGVLYKGDGQPLPVAFKLSDNIDSIPFRIAYKSSDSKIVQAKIPKVVFTLAIHLSSPAASGSMSTEIICLSNKALLDRFDSDLKAASASWRETPATKIYVSPPWQKHLNCEGPRQLRISLANAKQQDGKPLIVTAINPVASLERINDIQN